MRKLADYTLTRRLGVGGMGEVWMGRREALGGAAREVAIKLLSPERATNVEARRMFLDEARLSMLLRNSNIVQVHDVAEVADGTCYMVMEFVEGLNLAELSDKLRRAGEAMPDSIIAFIIGEVLKGLAHAHELRHEGQHKTVVHRDVSPHNVMLSVFGEVKIMDFGIARMASEDTSGVHVKGKLRYMPPEQLRGETREPTLDLFAVGAMLHELLDGVKFRSNVIDEGRLFGMILDGEIPALQRPADSIPKELDELRQKLLAASPKERIQSARQAFRQLSFWPGYRDTRFELDELVRRYVGHSEPQAAIAGTAVLPPPFEDPPPPVVEPASAVPLPVAAPAEAAGSFTGWDTRAPEEATATALLPLEGSDTDIARVRDSGTNTAVASRKPTPASGLGNKSKLISAALAIVGLVFVVLGANAMFGGDEPEVARADEHETGEPEPEPEQPPAAEQPAEVPETVEPPPAVEPEPPPPVVAEPEAAGEVLEVLEEKPAEQPQAEPVGEEPPKPKKDSKPEPPVTKTKVAISLGPGVAWAEVKIGGRTFELDAFAGKGASTRLSPGSHAVSCRMQVNGAWQSAGRVSIPEGQATMRLGKGCNVAVE
ncbi:MAG TPA: serine/threonine-protein kinase [Enhygromyxa sp.]|nr:serine/threonine-protein kinase [Enhygromyxa sp.]